VLADFGNVVGWLYRSKRNLNTTHLVSSIFPASDPDRPRLSSHYHTEQVAGRPSGTNATIAPSANTNDKDAALPVITRTANSNTPATIATTATRRAMALTGHCNRLTSLSNSAVSR